MAEIRCSNCGKSTEIDSAVIERISEKLKEAMEKQKGQEMEVAHLKFKCKHCGTENVMTNGH